MEYKSEINEFIVENFLFGDTKELHDNTNILESGIVDSTGILEIICYMEETYNLTIDDEEVTRSNFSTISSMDNFLQTKLSNNGNTN